MKKKRKVLIVDDDPAALGLLGAILARRGLEIVSFADPASALEGLKADRADLVISDLMMPKMDGIRFMTLAREIRPKLPVILITGNATVATAVSAMQWGAFDYLKKPYEIAKVREIVGRAIESLETGQAA